MGSVVRNEAARCSFMSMRSQPRNREKAKAIGELRRWTTKAEEVQLLVDRCFVAIGGRTALSVLLNAIEKFDSI